MPLRDPAMRGRLLAVLAKARRIREATPDPAELQRLRDEGWLLLVGSDGVMKILITGQGPNGEVEYAFGPRARKRTDPQSE